MSTGRRIVNYIAAFAMIIMLMLTAVSFAIFGNMNYYRQEFEKYEVTNNIDMSMDNIMYVMDELMDYLHSDRENLEDIVTEVNGEQRDFFSDKEKIHMADCKVLFDGAYRIKDACSVLFIALTVILIARHSFDIKEYLKICGVISIVIIILTAIIAVAAAIDFDACFVIFHKIFFNNDLWLFDPQTDLIINVLVEDFFADMALKIGIYCMTVPILLGVSGTILRFADKKR